MDIDRLQEFLLIAEQQSFRKSAERLGVSPAVLSARMATLEKSMGFRLLERDAHRVELTPKGQQFLPDAQQIVNTYVQTQKQLRSINYNTYRSLKIAISGTFMPARVGPYLDIVNLEHPDIHLELTDDHDFGVVRGLAEGLCDVYLTYGRSDLSFPGVAQELLYSAQTCALVNRSHPLFSKAHISMRELNGEQFALYPETAEPSIRDLEKRILEQSKIAYTTYDDAMSPAFYRLLVPIGKAIILCPWVIRDTLPPNTTLLSIDDAPDSYNMFLFCRENSTNPYLPKFLDGLRAYQEGGALWKRNGYTSF